MNKYVINGCSASRDTLVTAVCAIRNGYCVEKFQLYFSAAVAKAKLDTLTAVRTRIVDDVAALAAADIAAEVASARSTERAARARRRGDSDCKQ